MRWIIRLGFFLLTVVLLALGAVALIPGEKLAQLAQDQIEATTGRKVAITGDLKTSLFPSLGVKTGPITMANAPWSDQGPMLTAENVVVGVKFLPLLTGTVEIAEIALDQPKVLLEVAADGTVNWDFGTTTAAPVSASANDGNSAPQSFGIALATIKNADLRFIDHGAGTDYRLEALDVALRAPAWEGPIRAEFSGKYKQSLLNGEFDAPSLAKLVKGDVVPVIATASAGTTTLDFDGRAGLGEMVAEGVLRLAAKDLSADLTALGLGAAPVAAVTADANVTRTADGAIYLRNGKYSADGNALTGDVDVLPGQDRPQIKAAMTAGDLNLARFLNAEPTGAGGAARQGEGQGQGQGQGWSKDAIDVSGLFAADAEVSIAATGLDLGIMKFQATKILANLDRGRVVFNLRDLHGYNGNTTGEFVVNGRGGLSVGGKLNVAQVALEPLLKDVADYERLIGTSNFDLKFLAVGNSMDALMRSLSGNGQANVGDGVLKGLDLVGMLRTLDTGYQGEGQKTIFDAISASFTIADGVLSSDDLNFAAPLAQATGKGTVGIGAQVLDYRVTPVALPGADGTGGVKVPVMIKGPWADPKISLDMQAILDQELADEKAALEAKAIAAREAAKARAAEKLGIEQQEGESLEDAAKRKLEEEATKGILNLLGGN